jgi:hypothetical protein
LLASALVFTESMADATDSAIGVREDGESKNSNDFNPRQLTLLNRAIMFTSIAVIVIAGSFQIKQSSGSFQIKQSSGSFQIKQSSDARQ